MSGGIYIISKTNNPYYNQATIEHLYNAIPKDYVAMFIYKNYGSISIGRNLYCNKKTVHKSLNIYRRFGGGPSLQHSLGTINIDFVSSRSASSIRTQSAVISLALKLNGINCIRDKNQNITDNKGIRLVINSFDKSGIVPHHNLIINIDDEEKPNGLKPIGNDSINENTIINAIIHSFNSLYKNTNYFNIRMTDDAKIKKLAEYYASDEWLFNNDIVSPISENFAWGNIIFGLEVREGIINNAYLYSDSPYGELLSDVPEVLKGSPYLLSTMKDRIMEIPYTNKHMHVVRDLFRLFEIYMSPNKKL
ncbi:MAG: hypothetical protein GYA87_06990 [Christensenellaceae bacterium]|nr:hypothetical protein [Christensenellaceae bacterium]